jgi:TolA-binding protein
MVHKLKFQQISYFAAGVLILFFLIHLFSPDFADNFSPISVQSRDLYQKARLLQNQGEYRSAYNNYKKIPSLYSAYDIVLFQQAKCAAAFGDEKTVIKKLKSVLSYSKSPIKDQAGYALGQAYIRTDNYSAAEKQFLGIIKKYPDSNYALGSYYYLGEIYKNKKPEKTLYYWNKYIANIPDGRFALDIINGFKTLPVKKDSNINKNIGIVLYHAKKYKKSINTLEKIPLQQSWYYLAKANHSIGNNSKSLSVLKTGLKYYSNTVNHSQIEDAEALYAKINKNDSWNELINMVKNGRDYAMFQKAQLSSKSTALPLYKNIVKYYPTGNYASESLWNIFWDEYNKGRYFQVIELGQKHINIYKNTKAAPKILFWIGKSYEKTRNISAASNCFKKIISNYPDSYYAYRANGRLKYYRAGTDSGWNYENDLISDSTDAVLPYTYNEIAEKYNHTLSEMLKVQDYETAITLTKDPFLKSWINLKDGLVSRSIVLARDGMADLTPKPDFNDNRWKLIYPLYYAEEINTHAINNNIDPYLILSLVKEESHFNPLAISSSNARGLMQLLPGTAKDIARWDNLGSVSEFELFTPYKNLKLGSAYYRYIKKQLHGNPLFAVAAYNGGPGAVNRWLLNSNNNDPDQFVENIPYDQTRNYVKKVYTSYWNYKRIYK